MTPARLTASISAVCLAGCNIVLLATVLAACERTNDEAPPADLPPPVEAKDSNQVDHTQVSRYLRDHFALHGLKYVGWNRNDMRQQLGEPDSIVAELVANKHDATRTDTVFHVYYPNVYAEFYFVTEDGKEIVTEIKVSDNQHLNDAGVRIGDPWEKVRSFLGPPNGDESTNMYLCETCEDADDPLYVVVENGVVVAIRFTFYLD
jgi:hypothetical protein